MFRRLAVLKAFGIAPAGAVLAALEAERALSGIDMSDIASIGTNRDAACAEELARLAAAIGTANPSLTE